ncbi:alpha/beta hydrolase-fold protein [Oceanirhabdus seepicola]|uniref:DUF3327 domain-containing protein n=1 Tax=Oceanirhabdus seepicola TaxID=2828781 RepID=A0A9J6P709_9CLOT|nr:alpha/beta hydrolase-fold protein [Oceanirhabdus seepicola]MCM1991605.1 DUF3327 domain-containing protein [Oceanirhabdus seepicola]
MEKSLIKSLKIIELEDKLKLGNTDALENFWTNIQEKGSPIIEDIPKDSEHNLVTFIYKEDEKVENVLLIPEMEDCKFLNYRMERLLDTNLWYISCKIRNDIRLQYSFSINDPLDDNWDKRFEQIIHDKLNKTFLLIEDDEEDENEILSYVVMPNAEEHVWVKEIANIPKGDINKYNYKSEKLEEELELSIYTPHGYAESNKPYKFLVLTDGWVYINVLSAKSVLDNLIADKKIPPIVVLFVDCTDSRDEDLSCNDAFTDIIVGGLLPWFRGNYNISSEAKDGVIGGLSLGGLTASYVGLKHSETFGNVLSQSGSYWYKPHECEEPKSACWISGEFKKTEKLPLKFYLSVGVLEEKEDMIGVNKILRDVLRLKGYEVEYEEFKGGHDYLCWGENLANGLISLIGIK